MGRGTDRRATPDTSRVRRVGRRLLRALGQPKVFVPTVLSLALLVFLLSITDVPSVMDRITGIPVSTMAIVFALVVFYLVLKGIVFRLFIHGLGIRTTSRQLVLAFALAEMVIDLPAGDYAQNYVLRRIADVDFSISAAATTAMLAVEATISMLVLLVLAIPGLEWLQPTIAGVFVVSAMLVAALVLFERLRDLASRSLRSGPLRRVGPELLEMLEGMRSLATPETIVRAVPIAVIYLLALLYAFYLVVHGVGVEQFTFVQAVTVYLFALTVVMLTPFSTQIGVAEASGFGAMLAWGYDSTEALAALLGFRVVWMGSIWLACGPVVVLLRGELESASQ